MATTWLKALHIKQRNSRGYSIAAIINYVENPQKTDNGRLISSYECDSRVVDDEFMLAKKEYEYITGRSQGRRDIIAYHIRQSFKPGEVTPEEANKIGYELAVSFTKGRHAFVVCTHVDKAHIHNHIIYNSTTLDCTRKFKDFFFSGRAVRRISDLLCAEHGLSVIENPKPSKGSYGDWIGDKRAASGMELLKQKIDEIVPTCATFDEFLAALKSAGCELKEYRKHISVLTPDSKKFRRFDTLKGDYTEAAIRARLGTGKVRITSDSGTQNRISFLVDIQEKMREGKGAGYAHWAQGFNLKQSAKTLLFLQEQGVDSYEALVKKSSSASGVFALTTKRIKEIESRLKEISELQKQIGTYGKTRDIYAQYKASGWSKSFYDAHAADIILHRAAKKYFDELNLKKLPKMAELKQEYAALADEKKKLYSDYHKQKETSRELQIARANIEQVLGIKRDSQTLENSRKPQHDNHEI